MHFRTPARRTAAAFVLALGLVGGGTAFGAATAPTDCSSLSGEAQQDCRLDRLEAAVGVSDPTPTPTPTESATPTPTPTPSETPTPTQTPATGAVLGASLGQPLPVDQTLPAVRNYNQPSTWRGVLADEYANGTRVFVLSTKDSNAADMRDFLQTAPADATYYVTYFHEPDDEIRSGALTPATWCSRLNALGQAVAGMPNVEVGPIHNGWMGADQWRADEKGCDTSLWGYWGEDRYSPHYETPDQQYTEGEDYARSLGLPLVLGEVGASPDNASAQQTLAGQIRTWALDPTNDAAVVCWWQQTGYTLTAASERALLGN